MRPKIQGRTEELINMFLDRNIFSTQNEVIEAALDLLIEHQLQKDSQYWEKESQTPILHILSQVS